MLPNEYDAFGLSVRDVKTITDILVKHSDVTEVHIFGSRAKGSHKPGSDIDLAIMNDGVSEQSAMRIKAEFGDSTLPYKVDLINYTSLTNTDLREHVIRVGKMFYKRV